MIKKDALIALKSVDLEYDLHHDRTNNFKEFVINAITRKKYVAKKKGKFKALSDISFDVLEGERLGIIGLNGAGKSTLLKVISGILKPTRGTVTVHGNIQPLIEIGAGFDPEFSGRENIYFNGYMLGFTKRQVDEKLEQIIEFSGLKDFIEVPVKYYSSGMHVRLAFTIATSIEPEILVLDEMLGAGDIAFVDKAKARMNSLIETSRAMVLVSHDLGLIESLCTRCMLVVGGKIFREGNPTEIVAKYRELARADAL
ncbi:ABC transporter ATP-binding protein [soil metagenome]